MEYLVRFIWPGGESAVSAAENGSLLDAALAVGLPVDHHCRNGDCLRCAADLLADAASDREVLLCQTKVTRSETVHLHEDPFRPRSAPKLFPVRVTALDRLSSDILRLAVITSRNQVLDWTAGQYVSLKTPKGITRQYSIVDAIPSLRSIEFHIKLIEGGAFGGWLKDAAKIGDVLLMIGPEGRFGWRPRTASKTFMVATGTGIVPIYAMLKFASSEQIRQAGRLHVFWGNRVAADAYLDRELHDLTQSLGAKFVSALSREGDKVRVTDLLCASNFKGAQMFVAGHPQMVSDLRSLAIRNGADPHRIYTDPFTRAPG